MMLNPETGQLDEVTRADVDQHTPELVDPADPNRVVFQSWEGGIPQAYLLNRMDGDQRKLTDVKTAIYYPKFRNGDLYLLGFRSARYRLYRVKADKLLKSSPSPALRDGALVGPAWHPQLASLNPSEVKPYKPFRSSGFRLENLAAFFGSGSVGGIGGDVSDLMRDYIVSGQLAFLGRKDLPSAHFFITSQKGRSEWTAGAYYTIFPRADARFSLDHTVPSYLHREYGVLFAWQYPLTPFTFTDLELRLSGVNRTDFSDPNLAAQFDATNPGKEFASSPIFRIGYDRILYELFTGPIEGYSLLLESDTSFFPARKDTTERLRLDLARYFHFPGRTVLALQGIVGAAFGGEFKNPFFVSSDDIMRAYPFGDARLFGNYLAVGKAELRFPFGSLFGFPPLRGLTSFDYGTLYNYHYQAGERITSAASLGLDLNFPPVTMGFVFSKPLKVAPGPMDSSVFHFLLRYLYL